MGKKLARRSAQRFQKLDDLSPLPTGCDLKDELCQSTISPSQLRHRQFSVASTVSPTCVHFQDGVAPTPPVISIAACGTCEEEITEDWVLSMTPGDSPEDGKAVPQADLRVTPHRITHTRFCKVAKFWHQVEDGLDASPVSDPKSARSAKAGTPIMQSGAEQLELDAVRRVEWSPSPMRHVPTPMRQGSTPMRKVNPTPTRVVNLLAGETSPEQCFFAGFAISTQVVSPCAAHPENVRTPGMSAASRSPQKTPASCESRMTATMSIATPENSPEKYRLSVATTETELVVGETEMELMLDLVNHVPCNMMDRLSNLHEVLHSARATLNDARLVLSDHDVDSCREDSSAASRGGSLTSSRRGGTLASSRRGSSLTSSHAENVEPLDEPYCEGDSFAAETAVTDTSPSLIQRLCRCTSIVLALLCFLGLAFGAGLVVGRNGNVEHGGYSQNWIEQPEHVRDERLVGVVAPPAHADTQANLNPTEKQASGNSQHMADESPLSEEGLVAVPADTTEANFNPVEIDASGNSQHVHGESLLPEDVVVAVPAEDTTEVNLNPIESETSEDSQHLQDESWSLKDGLAVTPADNSTEANLDPVEGDASESSQHVQDQSLSPEDGLAVTPADNTTEEVLNPIEIDASENSQLAGWQLKRRGWERDRLRLRKSEEERLAAEEATSWQLKRQLRKAEEERIAGRLAAEEATKAEEARIAAEKAAQEKRLAAEAATKAEEERIAADKAAEEKRLAAQEATKAEEARMAAEKAEQDRLVREAVKAEEEERIAAQKSAEEERLAAEAAAKAEEKRIAAEKAAEEERMAAQEVTKAEEARLAAEKAEQDRLLREAAKAEEERIAAQKSAEEERLAAEAAAKAEEERIAAEKAVHEESLLHEDAVVATPADVADTPTDDAAQALEITSQTRTAEHREQTVGHVGQPLIIFPMESSYPLTEEKLAALAKALGVSPDALQGFKLSDPHANTASGTLTSVVAVSQDGLTSSLSILDRDGGDAENSTIHDGALETWLHHVPLDEDGPSHENASQANSRRFGQTLVKLFPTNVLDSHWQEWLQLTETEEHLQGSKVRSQDLGDAFIKIFNTDVSAARWQEWLQLADKDATILNASRPVWEEHELERPADISEARWQEWIHLADLSYASGA